MISRDHDGRGLVFAIHSAAWFPWGPSAPRLCQTGFLTFPVTWSGHRRAQRPFPTGCRPGGVSQRRQGAALPQAAPTELGAPPNDMQVSASHTPLRVVASSVPGSRPSRSPPSRSHRGGGFQVSVLNAGMPHTDGFPHQAFYFHGAAILPASAPRSLFQTVRTRLNRRLTGELPGSHPPVYCLISITSSPLKSKFLKTEHKTSTTWLAPQRARAPGSRLPSHPKPETPSLVRLPWATS